MSEFVQKIKDYYTAESPGDKNFINPGDFAKIRGIKFPKVRKVPIPGDKNPGVKISRLKKSQISGICQKFRSPIPGIVIWDPEKIPSRSQLWLYGEIWKGFFCFIKELRKTNGLHLIRTIVLSTFENYTIRGEICVKVARERQALERGHFAAWFSNKPL